MQPEPGPFATHGSTGSVAPAYFQGTQRFPTGPPQDFASMSMIPGQPAQQPPPMYSQLHQQQWQPQQQPLLQQQQQQQQFQQQQFQQQQQQQQQQQKLLLMEPPAQSIIPNWYPCENNWVHCIEKMNHEYQEVLSEFTGEWYDEERVLAETRMEKAKDYIYRQSEGRFGRQYQERTRTAHVVDIYQDWKFPGDNSSWYRGGESKDFHDLKAPAVWRRLQEFSMDIPYPQHDAVAGAFNPHGGRVYQGALEDFYLVAGMQAVGMKPELLADMFVHMDFSSPKMGVFTLRLYKHGQWHDVLVDDALPFDKDLNPLCCSSEFFPDRAWPSLVEKAYAKLHGSWEGLGGGGHIEEVMTDLTGGCAARYGTTDVAADRLWQYLHEMQHWCIFACNINEGECSKRSVPIEQHWACSIWRLEKHASVPYICVCLAAPIGTLRHLPVCDVPSPDGYGINEGFAWLRIDDFIAFFDTIYECRLVNTDLPLLKVSEIPVSPGWKVGFPWYEEMWAFQGNVYSETAPSFLMEIAQVPNVITLEASQTDVRYNDPHEHKEQGRGLQAPLLLRFYQCSPEVSDQGGGEIYLVHLSPWGHCRDACCGVKVMRPGKFLAMVSIPAKYTCNRMIFRTYSNKPIAMKPITSHRSWIAVNPARPLDALPYHLAGFQRVDAVSEKLPQMFDEAEGRGKPMANGLGGSLTGRLSNRNRAPAKSGGHKVVGKFGGRDAVATVEASEVQDGCSIA